ncbi:MAG: GGDEF domain-containing protein [Pirellulaceae bacterium]
MGALLLKIIFLSIAAIVGAIAGWWVRGPGSNETSPPSPGSNLDSDVTSHAKAELPDSSLPPEPAGEVPEQLPLDAVELLLAQLQQLTANVAADVGQHNSMVQEINDELTSADVDLDQGNVLAVVQKLVCANKAMQTQLSEAEAQLNEQAQEIELRVAEARTDALTKLWNRRYFDDMMQKCKEELTEAKRPSCLMLLDVDHFKEFNDTYGHQAGDEVLKDVAHTLTREAGKNIVCRYGGEEFAIIFPGSDLKTAIPVAESVRAAITDQVFEFDGLDLKITASSGLAQLSSKESVADVVKRADDALYISKENGRNRGYWDDGEQTHPIQADKLDSSESTDSFPLGHKASIEDQRDRISGLLDRATFQSNVARRIAEWKRDGAALSVLLVEVDGYDEILERQCEKTREVVLRAAAQFLKAAMRDADHVTRYDDHVFGLLLPGAGVSETSSVAERLRTAIARCSLPLDDEQLTFTVSLGAAEVAKNDSCDSLLSRAQLSLEAAKESGGNCSYAATANGEVRSMALTL